MPPIAGFVLCFNQIFLSATRYQIAAHAFTAAIRTQQARAQIATVTAAATSAALAPVRRAVAAGTRTVDIVIGGSIGAV